MKEQPPEETGACVLDKPQADFLYATSYLSLVSFVYALYREQYSLSVVPAAVFLTSIAYWRNPLLDCYARYLDMVCVQCALLYQVYQARNAEYIREYSYVTSAGILSFAAGYYLTRHWDILAIEDATERARKMWIVTYLHSGVHVLGNVANMVLYSGEV